MIRSSPDATQQQLVSSLMHIPDTPAPDDAAVPPRPALGAVAIGRNEGDRLLTCLHSLVGRVGRVVYVDSGSTDDSVAFAREGVRMLFERIEGLVTGEPRDVVVRHELIVRSSVSVPRERYKDS